MAIFYDTHAHLDYPDYADDLEQVLERAQQAGITRIVTIGTDLESSRRAVALSERHRCLFAAVGWHPTHVTGIPGNVKSALHELAQHPRVVAIGETGLDYYRLPSGSGGTADDDARYREKQAGLFRDHLEIAADLDLNVIIHQRDSMADTIRMLEPFSQTVRGVFHCFSGTATDLQRILALRSLVSFTGIVTFKNAQSVREIVASVPLEQFMLETDSPFLAPVPYRGKRCEPAYVKETAVAVAQTRGCTLDELSAATCRTTQDFFPRMSAA